MLRCSFLNGNERLEAARKKEGSLEKQEIEGVLATSMGADLSHSHRASLTMRRVQDARKPLWPWKLLHSDYFIRGVFCVFCLLVLNSSTDFPSASVLDFLRYHCSSSEPQPRSCVSKPLPDQRMSSRRKDLIS